MAKKKEQAQDTKPEELVEEQKKAKKTKAKKQNAQQGERRMRVKVISPCSVNGRVYRKDERVEVTKEQREKLVNAKCMR